MIRVEKVNKYFHRFRKNKNHVINNTTLSFDDTGLVALLGPSGSGKTTLLNVIGGLDKVNKGKIYINNKKITSFSTYKIDKIRNLNIGYIFQDYKLVDTMSVYDNVALSLKTIGIKDKKEIDKRVSYVLEKVGMYRYRKRPASMLSGGERQRVGIARAIVKNPNIILADEPTGNLDSKNSLEIMNIIKKISEDRLVILVTHEVNLAKFYASRIIEIEDGKVINDYQNQHNDNLDYTIDNNIYLKDMEKASRVRNLAIDVYRDKDTPINVEIVLKGNNIFIKSLDNRKIEIVDDNSSIEFINSHYKKLNKKDLEKYEFDFQDKLHNLKKLRYSSIFNPLSFLSIGFKKVFHYSLIKKLLLIGFFLSGFFIMMSTSRIAANLTIHDKNFVDTNKNYLIINTQKINIDDYYQFEKFESVQYILPGNSKVSLSLKIDDYYQTSNSNSTITGSLASTSMLKKDYLILGRMPENDNEIVIDKMVIDNVKKSFDTSKMIGLYNNDDFLNRVVRITNQLNMTIVGICDLESPSIYASDAKFIDILYNANEEGNRFNIGMMSNDFEYHDYHLFQSLITIKQGRLPENDYEVIVSIDNKDAMPLNKEIDNKINDKKLVVVGYYDSEESFNYYFVNSNMVKQILISQSKNITIYPKDKETALKEFRDKNLNIQDSYELSKKAYLKQREEGTKVAIHSSLIVLAISLVEIFLMLRSSFLSRIKEVGIYRAIGLKKKDIYIMFMGEIIAITTLTSIPGILLSAYIFDQISHMKYFVDEFLVNQSLVLAAVIIIYLFNLICGLAPVFNTLRKRPAQILARTDVE